MQSSNYNHRSEDVIDLFNKPETVDMPLIDGLVDSGSLVAVVGPAKAGKSFLCAELAVCIAFGCDFYGRKVAEKKVYYVNIEVSERQSTKRLKDIFKRHNLSFEEMRGRLFVHNLRGCEASWDNCYEEAVRLEADVVIIDPFYQVFKGCETNESDCLKAIEKMKKFLDKGMTTFVVFHAPKGFSGDRQIVDMISGSSVLVRFPENVIAIMPHAEEKDARVIDCSVLRNYPAPDPFAVKMKDGAFVLAPDIEPKLKSYYRRNLSSNQRTTKMKQKIETEQQKKERLENSLNEIISSAGDDLLSVSEVKEKLYRQGFPKHKVDDFVAKKIMGGKLKKCSELDNGKTKPKRNGGKEFISTPERVDNYIDSSQNISSQSSRM